MSPARCFFTDLWAISQHFQRCKGTQGSMLKNHLFPQFWFPQWWIPISSSTPYSTTLFLADPQCVLPHVHIQFSVNTTHAHTHTHTHTHSLASLITHLPCGYKHLCPREWGWYHHGDSWMNQCIPISLGNSDSGGSGPLCQVFGTHVFFYSHLQKNH